MKKIGTHWKPQKRTEIAEETTALRPVKVVTLPMLQAQKWALEAELRELFAKRRAGEGGLPISRRSRQLREVKQQIAVHQAKVKP